MKYLKGSILLILALSSQLVFGQFKIPEKPSAQTSLYDYINLLSPSEKNTLEQKLIRYADSTSTQIVVTIINSTEGENINYLGAKWGQKWGIGQSNTDNGLLVILAHKDRRVAINTGYGLEGSITDALSRRIIETRIIPYFKQGQYYEGLSSGADALFMALNGEFKEDRALSKKTGGGSFRSFLPFIIFIVIFIILASKNKRGGGNGGKRSGGFDIWDAIILSNMGRGGFGGGSSGGFGGSSGGGFGGGFGGGGFGGGGASGGW